MRILMIGAGGVGEAIARIGVSRDPHGDWLEQMVIADRDLARASVVAAGLGDERRFIAQPVDAADRTQVTGLIETYRPDLLMNVVDPRFNVALMDAAFEAGVAYMDTGSCASEPHPNDPYHQVGVLLGAPQWEQAPQWESRGLLGMLGCGVEPGMSDFFARFAERHLFDEIHEIGVRDGGNLHIPGDDAITFSFNVWATVEECLNPPLIWEKERGFFTTELFSEPEVFVVPEGIGPLEMVNVEHSEVVFIARNVDAGLRRVTFKYGLGDRFIEALKTLRACNLHSKQPIKYAEGSIVPLDFLASVTPSPAQVGRRYIGKTAAGVWVRGTKDGLERQLYLYQVADNEECMERLGCQAVVAQTAFTPVILMELMAKGEWDYVGLRCGEMCNPEPYVALMGAYGFPAGLMEMESPYRSALEQQAFSGAAAPARQQRLSEVLSQSEA